MPTSEASGRTPLMAGNWKMNLDHLQGAHLVQKLDWTLKEIGRASCRERV